MQKVKYYRCQEFKNLKKILILADVCFVCMYACPLCECLVLVGLGRGHRDPWNWGDKWLGASVEVLRSDPGPLQEQRMFLTTSLATSPAPLDFCYGFCVLRFA